MRRVATSRREHLDLLSMTPSEVPLEDRWTALLIDPVAQLTELADLVARGLVTPEEFERQRRKVFGALPEGVLPSAFPVRVGQEGSQ